MSEKFHEKLKKNSLTYLYFIHPVGLIEQVDNERRKIIKSVLGSKYISMLNYGDVYLLVFKKKKDYDQVN